MAELVSAVKAKHSGLDYLQEVLEAESILEQFLEQQDGWWYGASAFWLV